MNLVRTSPRTTLIEIRNKIQSGDKSGDDKDGIFAQHTGTTIVRWI